MYTMKESKRNPVIRVKPETRIKLKVLAAQHNVTMQDCLEILVNYALSFDFGMEIERQQKGEQAGEKSL